MTPNAVLVNKVETKRFEKSYFVRERKHFKQPILYI